MNAEVLVKFKGNTDELDKSTDKATKTVNNFASGVAKGFKIAGAAIATAATAVGVLVKKSVDAYAEFEQLEGGLVSLFGEGSKEMQAILGTSEKAWKNLTLSQNDYLTAFQSSYPLVNAGLSKNADSIEYTNKMLQISSDLFNTYGGSIEGYQNAINWALKGSFVYLDNLNIGIKGTQEGFIEAANASGVLGRTIKDVKDLTNDEIIDVIQHYTKQYGVWGKTADEAGTTILGSLNMVKATWNNFISGLSKNDADINKLIDNLINAVMTFGNNIMPVLERTLGSIASSLPKLANKITKAIPGLVEKVLPGLVQGAVNLIQGLVKALPKIIPVLMDGIIVAFKGLVEILPVLIDAVLKGAITIIEALAEEMPTLLPIVVDAVLGIIPVLIDNLPLLIDAGFKLLMGIVTGLLNAIPTLISNIPKIGKALLNYLMQLPGQTIEIGANIIKGLWNGLSGLQNWVISKVKSMGKSIINGLKNVLGIHSPSTEFAMLGKFSVLGYTEALDKMSKDIDKQVAETFSLSPQLTGSMQNTFSPSVQVYNNVNVEQDPLGQMVKTIKTFSGGSPNDYNYGAGA